MDAFLSSFSHPFFEQILSHLPVDVPFYLVGGAIRDSLLQKPSYDLDFVTPADAMKYARKLADRLGGAYFPLDTERNVARIIYKIPGEGENTDNRILRVDVSKFQGVDLTHDLLGRDFTINAMALDVHHPDELIDPTRGAADLLAKQLRVCSEKSFLNDPVRILRAVRFSVNLRLAIQPDTLKLLREAASHLSRVSAERIRDELFRILVLPNTATSMRLLDKLGIMDLILPEVGALKPVQQSAPHIMDAWNHTLASLKHLEDLLEVLALDFNPDKASNLTLGMVALQLGRYRDQISQHLKNALNPDRPHRGLIFLACLYHDVGKLSTQSVDDSGRIRFIGHEHAGYELVIYRGQELKLSRQEIDRLSTIVNHHMHPSFLSHNNELPSPKAIYRFFRNNGVAGLDICILSLADMLATYGPTLPVERWTHHLEVVRMLFHAWWENRDEQVLPNAVVNGKELIAELGLSPGPTIGYILEAIREAQISGEISSKEDAFKLAKQIIDRDLIKKTG